MFNIHLWHLPSTKPTRWSSRTNMLAVCGRQRSPLMNWMAFEQREWVSVGDIKISRTWKNNLISSAGFELPKCCFLESGIKMKICSVMPCNMLTFTFLEKHVSLNYNPCWYQNVCSLNIYKPRVTSKAEHRHLETSFFFFSPPPPQLLCPKGNAVKALQTILQASQLLWARDAFLQHLKRLGERKSICHPTNCAA